MSVLLLVLFFACKLQHTVLWGARGKSPLPRLRRSCSSGRTRSCFFFLFTRSRLQSHEGEFWSMLMVGLPALSRPVVSASLHKQCTKRNRGFTDEGRVETKETKKEEEQRKWEVWKFVEALKVLKMDYHT